MLNEKPLRIRQTKAIWLDLALEMLDRNAETPKTLRLFSVCF